MLLVLIVVSLTGGITFGIVFASYYFEGKYLGTKYISIAVMSIMSAYCMAARSLYDAAMAVFNSPFDLDDYVYRAVMTACDIAKA
jgi:hypothetical protein